MKLVILIAFCFFSQILSVPLAEDEDFANKLDALLVYLIYPFLINSYNTDKLLTLCTNHLFYQRNNKLKI